MAADVRTRQIDAVKHMLNLNSPKSESTWKILVFDEYGRDIIAPLLTVKELRECGVTLNLLIADKRDPIPDVPVVYFVMPTKQNIDLISQDCKNQMYEKFYINFITAVSRQLLEDLAQATIESDSVARVEKIFDQYLSFCMLEQNLFTVSAYDAQSCSYYALNRPDAKDADIEKCINAITDSVFSLFVTLRELPVIRCPKGNAAEIVAERLEKKMRDARRDPKSELFKDQAITSFQRPLLILLDRNMDICSTLHHTWTYQALIHDLFNLYLNRCKVEVDEKVKNYDLGPDDQFWAKNKGKPFPEVADAVHVELEACRAAEQEIKRLKDVMGESGVENANDQIANTVSSLPELMERKKRVDMHINIATALSDCIRARNLDKFFEVEEKIMTKTTLEESVLDTLKNPSVGTAEDKLRLFIIYYLTTSDLPDNELQQYIEALQEAGCDTSCIEYLAKLKSVSSLNVPAQTKLTSSSGSYSSMSNMFKYVKQSSKFMMEGVKSLVVGHRKLPVTRTVDCLSELKQTPETDSFLALDPKIYRKTENLLPALKNTFNDVYVFVVGGGSYVEYQNLMTYSEQHPGKRIVYGSSEMMDSKNFLDQLTKLGSSSS
ncbi:hypothetical protein ACHWQZ_G009364 [Mnemiopsis leidyi]